LRCGSPTKLLRTPLKQRLEVGTIGEMPGPFDSAKRKVARAGEHFANLEREIQAFIEVDPYRQVIEIDPTTPNQFLHKVKLIKDFDDTLIAELVGDIVSNLRASLDHAIYAVAAASGQTKIRNAYFPFAHSAAELEPKIKGRCADVPGEMYPLLRSFNPYDGGNYFLHALQALRNADNHSMLTPFGTDFQRPSTKVESSSGFVSMVVPEHSRWNRVKQEVVYLRTSVDSNAQYEIDFKFFVAFDEPSVVAGRPVIEELYWIGCEVANTIEAIEAESRRLGFTQ
jgi:hypothetical protein